MFKLEKYYKFLILDKHKILNDYIYICKISNDIHFQYLINVQYVLTRYME